MIQKRISLLFLCAWCAFVGMVAQQVTQLEYWIDIDAASRQSTAPSSGGTFSFEVDANALSPGIHTLSLRTQDDSGQWGTPLTHYFLRTSPVPQAHTVNQYEYWIDHDGESVHRTAAGSDGLLSLTLNLDSLASGIHTLTVRAQDEREQWGTPMTHYFLRTAPTPQAHTVSQYEYWIDHGGRNVHRATADSDGLLSLTLNLDSLTSGIHTLSVRAQDDSGEWGTPMTHYFVRTAPIPQAHTVSQYEYWIDHNGRNVHRATADADGILSLELNVDTLSRGLHSLAIRAEDDGGQWSAPITHYFYHNGKLHESRIVGCQYWFNAAYDHAIYLPITPGQNEVVINKNVMTRDLLQREPTAEEIASGEEVNLYLGVENEIHVRFQDDTGAWGQIETDTFIYMGIGEVMILAEGDWQLLREAHEMTDGDHWTATWIFGETAADPVELPGVTVANDEGHVTAIDLTDYNLCGPFPHPLLRLPTLHTLKLADNHLEGDLCEGMDNNLNATALRLVDLSGNQLTGNIGQFAAHCLVLKSLNAQGNSLHSVDPSIATTVTELNLQTQSIQTVSRLHTGHLSADTILASLPSIVTYDHQNQCLSPDVSLLWTTADNSWKATMSYQDGLFSLTSQTADRTYRGNNGDTLMVTVADSHRSLVKGTTFPMSLSFSEGDTNFDGEVNVLDLQTEINYILETYGNRLFNYTAANLWNDDRINAQDAVVLVNLLMNTDEQPSVTRKMAVPKQTDMAGKSAEASVYVSNGHLMLTNSKPVAAFDLTLHNASELTFAHELTQMGFVCSVRQTDAGLRLIVYSLAGATLPTGETVIGSVEGQRAALTRAMLASGDAQAVSVMLNVMPTGIKPTDGSMTTDGDRYDLQGRKAESMPLNGVYIQEGQKVVHRRPLEKMNNNQK